MIRAEPPVPLRVGPVSPAQELLWRLDRRVPGTALNIATALALEGPLDAAALEEAFHRVAQRHEPLRTRYRAEGGEPRAEVLPAERHGWESHDLRGLAPGALSERLDALVERACLQPFDLAAGRPVRAVLARLGERRWAWLLGLHHVSADGWGMVVFSRDLSALYRSLVRGEPCRLSELTAQAIDYAEWQADWRASPEAAAEREGWRIDLGDPPVRPLAIGRGGSGPRDWYVPAGLRVASVPAPLVARLQAVRVRERTSAFMLLLAAFKLLLARWSGQEDVVVGTLLANRTWPESGDLLGAHYNTVLLRTDLAGCAGARDLLARVTRACLAVHERQRLPFAEVARLLRDELNQEPSRLLRAMFQHDEPPLRRLALPGIALSDLDWSAEALAGGSSAAAPALTRHRMAGISDLSWHVRETPGGLDLYVFYDLRFFAEETIAWLIESYVELIGGLLAGLDEEGTGASEAAPLAAVAPGAGRQPPAVPPPDRARELALLDAELARPRHRNARALARASPAGALPRRREKKRKR